MCRGCRPRALVPGRSRGAGRARAAAARRAARTQHGRQRAPPPRPRRARAGPRAPPCALPQAARERAGERAGKSGSAGWDLGTGFKLQSRPESGLPSAYLELSIPAERRCLPSILKHGRGREVFERLLWLSGHFFSSSRKCTGFTKPRRKLSLGHAGQR